MHYSSKQILTERRFFPGDKKVILWVWLSLLLPLLYFQWLIPSLVLLAGLIVFDLGLYKTGREFPQEIAFDISWPTFLELKQYRTINIEWETNPEDLHLHIFFPKEFSPRVHHVTQNDNSIQILGKNKGVYSDTRLYVSRLSKLKLFRFYYKLSHDRKLKVVSPILYFSRNCLQKLDERIPRYLGGESEFHSVRQYQADDSFRRINWKKTALSSEDIYVNEYEKEHNQRVVILVNNGMSSQFDYKGYSYSDYQTALAFQLAITFLKKQDHTGLLVYSNKVDTFIPPELNQHQTGLLFHYLQHLTGNYESSELLPIYMFLKDRLQAKSILIFLSPFLSFRQIEAQKKTISLLGKMYQIIWVNPLRGLLNYSPKDDVHSLWARVHTLYDENKQNSFFNHNRLAYVHELPDKLYQGIIRNYSSLKW